jgi:hypothetical protein
MLQNAINAARVKAKKALALLYEDTCTIYANMPVLDEATGITEYLETALHENVPCRISFGSAASAAADELAPEIQQQITLFLAPGVDVPAGCKISVTREGKTVDYSRSGEPSVYKTHQEIKLELFERYA